MFVLQLQPENTKVPSNLSLMKQESDCGLNMWPRGVVVSALTSHVRGAGFGSWPG